MSMWKDSVETCKRERAETRRQKRWYGRDQREKTSIPREWVIHKTTAQTSETAVAGRKKDKRQLHPSCPSIANAPEPKQFQLVKYSPLGLPAGQFPRKLASVGS